MLAEPPGAAVSPNRVRARDRKSRQGPRDRPRARRDSAGVLELVDATGGRARRRGDGRDARGERPAEGGRRCDAATGLPAIADDTGLDGRRPRRRARRPLGSLRRGARHVRRQRRHALAARCTGHRAERDGRRGSRPSRSPAGPTVVRSSRSGAVEGRILTEPRGTRRLRVRPGVRARRRRRSYLCRDDRGREARASRTGAERSDARRTDLRGSRRRGRLDRDAWRSSTSPASSPI